MMAGRCSCRTRSTVNAASQAFIDSAAELQLPVNDDFNGAKQAGFGMYQVTQNNGERWSAARAYVEPLKDSANLTVRTDTLVERLVIRGRPRHRRRNPRRQKARPDRDIQPAAASSCPRVRSTRRRS